MNLDWARALADLHCLIVGGTRKGKSSLLVLIVLALLRRGCEGITAIDPHGSFVRAIIEFLANPANGIHGRKVLILEPSGPQTFGLNPLAPLDSSWEACHDAANTLVSVIESRFEASPEETPRLSRIVYVTGMLCAWKQLTLLELMEILSLGADEIRRSLLQDFDNTVVRRELEDLHLLASKQPTRFLELVESAKNRFVRWLGDPRLARILGQKHGLDPRVIMDGRYIVLADLSSLSYEDAAFLGCIMNSMYFVAARRRPPMQCARHRMILDEAESLLTIAVARMCDQSAKVGLNLVASLQRLGQLRARGDFLCDALLENCGVKIAFGIHEVESAKHIAENFFTGHVDLEQWVESSLRPVAVGSEKRIVNSWSHAEHRAEHETHAHARSHTRGEAVGTMISMSTATGEFIGSGDSAGLHMSFPASLFGPNAPNASMGVAVPLSQTSGENNSRGSSEQSSTSSGTSHVDVEMFGEAETHGYGTSFGTSKTEGESEVFTTVYDWMPSQRFSVNEQLHKLTGELMTLQRRELFIKIEGNRPMRTRTADVPPAFRSPEFKRAALPAFRKAVAARSSYLLPAADVDAQIAARLAGLKPVAKPEPDFTAPAPLVQTLLEEPKAFAAEFWRKRAASDKAPKPKKPKTTPGRRPVGDLDERHGKFLVVDGDLDGGDKPK
jgi:hypothetical protein